MKQVPKSVKEERAKRGAAVAAQMREEYLNACVGKIYPVLFEQPKGEQFFGHAPNYMEVLVNGEDLHNTVKNVRIVAVEGESLIGEIVEE
jgi:threonylcarbamoyladenosine tRNA methylthiotransferase MtaB